MSEILNAGTTLALNENSKKLDEVKKSIYIIGGAFIITIILLVALGLLFMDKYDIIDYVAYKIASKGCV